MKAIWSVGVLLVACQAGTGEGLGSHAEAVVGGAIAAEGQFPAVVRTAAGCTMTRIGPRHFLTAAHCMHTAATRPIFVGSAHPTSLGEFQEDPFLSRQAPYDGNRGNHKQYDLAVITLKPGHLPAYGDLQLLAPLPVLSYVDSPPGKEWVTLVGYGYNMPHGLPAGGGVKRFGQAETGMPDPGCKCTAAIDPSYSFEAGHGEFVADAEGVHYVSTHGVLSAPGDSGSPILRGDTIIGVLSGGIPNMNLPVVAGPACDVASRIDVAFVDSVVRAPVIDGLSDTGDVDPQAQAGLPTVVFHQDQPAILTLRGHRLAGATLTWDNGSPIAVLARQDSTDSSLGVDTVVLTLQTKGESENDRFVVATHGDTTITSTSTRAVRIECGADKHDRCFDVCVDYQTDPQNCGDCGNRCPSGEVCSGGQCHPPDDPPPPGGDDDGGGGGGRGQGSSIADPHLRTFDGFNYSQQQDGEFVFAADEQGAMVQVRQERFADSWLASVNTAVAIKVGARRVAFYGKPTFRVLVDGVLVDHDQRVDFEDGAYLARDEELGDLVLHLAGGDRVMVVDQGGYLDVHLDFAIGNGRKLFGLLGDGNGVAEDDLRDRDGSLRPADPSFANVAGHAESWRLSAMESLFDYAPGETTASFDDPVFPLNPDAYLDPASVEYQAAEKYCRDEGVPVPLLEMCITDMVLTGGRMNSIASYREMLDGLSPRERQAYQCIVGTPDRPACEACCASAFGQGPNSHAALADATVFECMCAARYGACESECAGDCASPASSAPSEACQTCLNGLVFAPICAQDPTVACNFNEQCLFDVGCQNGCATR